jgi:serine/threonine protein kinase
MAVKSYFPGWEDTYYYEDQAFKAVQGKTGFVQWLGTYSLTAAPSLEREPRVSYHMLLEYGEQDLDEYLAEWHPPVLHTEIVEFWEDLFKIADSIKELHYLRYSGQSQVSVTMKGCVIQMRLLVVVRRLTTRARWHGDIKPDNILRVHGEFKLADFGFTGFASNIGESGLPLIGGTSTYCEILFPVSKNLVVPSF